MCYVKAAPEGMCAVRSLDLWRMKCNAILAKYTSGIRRETVGFQGFKTTDKNGFNSQFLRGQSVHRDRRRSSESAMFWILNSLNLASEARFYFCTSV